mgnify:CR=1 FL=1
MSDIKTISDPFSQFRLDHRTAVVTGAGKGIGRACAEVLASAGASVLAVARTPADLEALQAAYPENVTIWPSDATSDEFISAVANLETLDILVNNVGINRPQAFVDVDTEALDSVLNVNVRAAFRVSQAAARAMLRHESGSIIHMSSQMGHVGAPLRSVYCMTKHAIEGLTKAMAVELAQSGIRVNAVAPTFIETPLTRPMLEDPEFREDVLSRIPLNHLGQVKDVANAVLYLAGDAAAMVTGESLRVDCPLNYCLQSLDAIVLQKLFQIGILHRWQEIF